jgi:membrane fusion protein
MQDQPSLFRQEAVDFQRTHRQWGEVLLPQQRSAQILFATILVASMAILVLLSCATYARKETVIGYLAPTAGVVRVFAPRAGIIRTVHVTEGQSVAEGDALLTIAVDQTSADGSNVDAAVLRALSQQRALIAERIATHEAIADLERQRLQDRLEGLGAETAAIAAQIAAQQERVRLATGRASSIEPLRARGVVSDADYKLRLEAQFEQRRGLAALGQELVAKQGEQAATLHAVRQLPASTAEKIQALRNELLETEQRVAEIEGRRAYVVRAPMSGRISARQAIAGRTADPRQPLLSILPHGSVLHAELFVPTRAAGFIRSGQDVRLLYDAFPFQRFGAQRGRVMSISQTVLLGADISAPVALQEPAYLVVVALERQDIWIDGAPASLRADMLLRADIILERRALVAWLLDPLLRVRIW